MEKKGQETIYLDIYVKITSCSRRYFNGEYRKGKAFICVDKIDYAAGKFCSAYKKVRKHLHIHMEEEDSNYEK